MPKKKLIPVIFARFSAVVMALFILQSQVLAAPLVEQLVTMDDGHKLTLYSRGAENPTATILLIHGRTWSALPDFDLLTAQEDLSMMNALVKEGMAVYAIDLRGYGKTPRDKSGWNTPERAAKDTSMVLDYIDGRHKALKGTTVFGWSNGSLVAMLTAQKYPEKVKNLVLYGFPIDTEMTFEDSLIGQMPHKKPTTAKAAAEDFIVPGTISKEAIDAYVKAALEADPVRADWNRLSQWNQLDAANILVPTLLLQAEYDPLANQDADALFFKKLATQDKQWVILSNADHAALLESARFRLYHAVVSFMQWSEL
ncbi:MAG: alpha-beta hydrolase superfamily lysophospholipase [Pseudohongiellaceae bacterium]|jgi:alpha-beta hydrolase superfamily lysophospholipase